MTDPKPEPTPEPTPDPVPEPMPEPVTDVAPRCPRCGRGELVDIGFDEGGPAEVPDQVDAPWQGADTRQVETYSCGHRVIGPRLSLADAERMDVERRTSDDTVTIPSSDERGATS
jgi:hypothetical protein